MVNGATPRIENQMTRLRPIAVADRAADQAADRDGEQEYEQIHLRRLHRQMEFLDEVEAVVARDAREVEILRENQHQQDDHRPGDAAR